MQSGLHSLPKLAPPSDLGTKLETYSTPWSFMIVDAGDKVDSCHTFDLSVFDHAERPSDGFACPRLTRQQAPRWQGSILRVCSYCLVVGCSQHLSVGGTHFRDTSLLPLRMFVTSSPRVVGRLQFPFACKPSCSATTPCIHQDSERIGKND